MKIIEQLNKLPIQSGDYLVLPNLDTPYFVIPLHSRSIFLNAISLVKPKNKKGWIKKIALRCMPFFFLRKLFPVITLHSENVNNSFHQLILPWNQDVCNKFTLFNFNKNNITLVKIGFGKYRKMISDEYYSILKIPKFGKNIIPEVVDFYEDECFTKIETIFYDGNHPKNLPRSIIDFFEKIRFESKKVKMIDHPYVMKIMREINFSLKKEKLFLLLNTINEYVNKNENELISLVLMHADCSQTNVITTLEKNVIIDWEECVLEGIPIDIGYFDFRMHIDNGKSWKANNTINFLVVLHYIYLQIKHDNISQLRKISWHNSEISI